MATVFIPDIFSAYLNGKRMAIQDNWSDLKNYNEVLKGQLQNAATMANFGDTVRRGAAMSLSQQAKAISDSAGLDQMLALLQAQNQLGVVPAQAAATLRGIEQSHLPVQAPGVTAPTQQSGTTAPMQQGVNAPAAGAQQPAMPTPPVRNPLPPTASAAQTTDAPVVTAMAINGAGGVDASGLTPEQQALYDQLVTSGTPEDQAYDYVANRAV